MLQEAKMRVAVGCENGRAALAGRGAAGKMGGSEREAE